MRLAVLVPEQTTQTLGTPNGSKTMSWGFPTKRVGPTGWEWAVRLSPGGHPHAHCLASRGVWDEKGQWLPVPYIDTNAAEKLFAHKIFRFLKSKDLLSDERIE